MYASMLFCEEMEDNEAIYFRNLKRYADYTGYGYTLKYKELSYDRRNERRNIVALDATRFNYQGSEYEFSYKYMKRELNKAYIAF